jgi:homoserine dehydrogenase
MKQVNIGIIGYGTVGSAVGEVIRKNRKAILAASGVDLEIKKVCDLRKKKTFYPFTRDPYEIIRDPEVSIVVEAIGGVNPALRYILEALKNGKHVVTPNKEVIAKHLSEILEVAQGNKVQVLFEGAVGGGIPILHALQQSLAGNQISEIYGIVNGTTNYILSKMTEEGLEFSEALERAKVKGYAEADPKMDIEGYDAAFKAGILAMAAFRAKMDWRKVYREGIAKVALEDIKYASEIGYVVKPLAIVKKIDEQLEVRVHPALVPRTHPLAAVSENFNAIYVKGFPVGELMFYGPGAGGNPTASAVVSDILALAKGVVREFPLPLEGYKMRRMEKIKSRYYLRLQAPDRYGVLAGIAKAFAKRKVSIAAVTQKETVGNIATIVILLHEVQEQNFRAALEVIRKLPVVYRICNVIRML